MKKSQYFKPGAKLTEAQKRYCRCLMHTADQKSRGYNPYALCSRSVQRRGTVECSANYDFSSIPEHELLAYATLFYDEILHVNDWNEMPLAHADLIKGLNRWVDWKFGH